MKLQRSAFIHPPLFALWMIFLLYGIGLGEFLPEDMIFPAFVYMTAAVLMTLIAGLVLGSMEKGAAISSLVCIVFPFFQQFELGALPILAPLLRFGHAELLVLAVYLGLWLPLIIIIVNGKLNWGGKKTDINFDSLTRNLNLTALVVCTAGAIPIISYELPANLKAASIVKSQLAKDRNVSLETGKHPPDIYYIILDAFANPYTLQTMYGYDSSKFVKFLEDRGFYVARKSIANHDYTNLSVASSLNMEYMNFLEKILGRESTQQTSHFRMIKHSRVTDLLTRHGYKLINVGSGCPPTGYLPGAYRNYIMNLGNSLNPIFLGMSILAPLEPYTHVLRNVMAMPRLFLFDNIEEIAAIPGPKFVMCHSLVSHPPVLFDANGKAVPMPREQQAQPFTKETYLEQLKFSEKKTEELIDRLLSGPGKNAIIVIQSDHGPYSYNPEDRKNYINERMRIFNAYYFPDGKMDKLYPSISPVNTFRVIFNKFFGTTFPKLEDRSYASFKKYHFMHFNDVTPQISFPDEPSREKQAIEP